MACLRDDQREAGVVVAPGSFRDAAFSSTPAQLDDLLTAFEAAPVAVAVARGPQHVIVYRNPVHRRIFGDRPTGVPGREAFPELEPQGLFELMDRVLASGEPYCAEESAVWYDRDGDDVPEEHYFTFSYSAIKGEGATNDGVLVVAVDVTAHVTARREIEERSEELGNTLERYRTLVDSGSQVLWVADAAGQVIEPSRGWERLTGQSWEQLRGFGWLDALHPDDRDRTADAWRKAVAEVSESFEHEYRVRTADGTYRHFRVRAAPVLRNGAVIEWIGTDTDIEEQTQIRLRLDLLARATAAVNAALEPEAELRALADIVVPGFADSCSVYLVDSRRSMDDESVTMTRVALAQAPHLESPLPVRAKGLQFRGENPVARAALEGRAVLVSLEPGVAPEWAVESGTAVWHRANRPHTMVAVPVVAAGSVVAVVNFTACEGRPAYTQADLGFLAELAARAAVAVEHGISHRRAEQVALALQHSLLTEPPAVEGLEVAVRYRPAQQSAEVGGDWYDAFTLPDGTLCVAIGDVIGHDLGAASAMGQLRSLLSGVAYDTDGPPGYVLSRLDRLNTGLSVSDFTTLIYGRIERDESGASSFRWANAGHPPPLLVYPDGGARILDAAEGLVLGVDPDSERMDAVEKLPEGSTLVLYTDGMVERRDASIDDGIAAVAAQAARHSDLPLGELCDRLIEVAPDGDDLAMLLVRVTPPK